MKGILSLVFVLSSSAVMAQSWSLDSAQSAMLPAPQSGLAMEGARLTCVVASGGWTLAPITSVVIGDGSFDPVPVVLTVDGTAFPAIYQPSNGLMEIPAAILGPLKAGNRLTLTLPSGGAMTETVFSLSGSRAVLDSVEAACATAVAAAAAPPPAPAPASEGAPDTPATLAIEGELVAGGTITVQWQGPNGAGDWIGLAPPGSDGSAWVGGSYSYTSGGASLNLPLPAEGGDYELRYISADGNRILASLDVTVPVADLPAVTLAPQEAATGSLLTVELPDAPRGAGDYLYIAPAGTAETDYSGGYVAIPAEGPAQITAPTTAGDWELRYVVPFAGSYRALGAAALTLR